MSYQPDLKLVYKMQEKLAEHFKCSCRQVIEFKQNLIIEWLKVNVGVDREYSASIAEYYVVMEIAEKGNDPELAHLMHLYSVGYFRDDTQNYQPKAGDEYEIINLNYLNAFDKCGVRKTIV